MNARVLLAAAVAGLLAAALDGCASAPTTGGATAKAPPVTTAMAAAQQVDLAMLHAGRASFVGRCARCHALPGVHDESAAAWPGVVAKMAKRSGLTPEQTKAVTAYILAARGP